MSSEDKRSIRIADFLKREDISASERSFALSIESFMGRNGRISNKQWSAFQRMEARYSPEVIAQRAQWYESWTSEKAENIIIAAKYYRANPPYFGDLADKVLTDPDFVPSEKQYRKMVENKYVQKVLLTMRSEPIFEVGALVQVRKTARGSSWPLRERNALVVANNGPVTSAAKGARTYTILPFGESNTVDIQERYLKKKRR